MAVDNGAITSVLPHGAVPLWAVDKGMHTSDGGPRESLVRDRIARVADVVVLTTRGGRSLTLTPNQRLLTPDGAWVPAREARGVVIVGYGMRTQEGLPASSRDALMARDEAVTCYLQARIREVTVVGHDALLVIGEGDVEDVQRALLALGVFSERPARRPSRPDGRRMTGALLVRQPSAARLASRIDIPRTSTREHLLVAKHVAETMVDRGGARATSMLLERQGLSGEKSHPGPLREIQEINAGAMNGVMSVRDAERLLAHIALFPVRGDLLDRARLVSVLKSLTSASAVEAVASVTRAGRLAVVGLVGADFLADGFVCRGERAGDTL